jgi:phage shock protein PspC (stress-responsive transcriptional regulator)
MALFPYKTFTIKTNLNKDEIIQKLSKNCIPINKLGWYNILSSQPFAGEILGNRFKIYEHYPFGYAKSNYVIEGEIVENGINVKLSLGPLLKTIMLVLTLVFGLAGLVFLYIMLRDNEIDILKLFPAFLPILVYISTFIYFNFYSARIEKILGSILIE